MVPLFFSNIYTLCLDGLDKLLLELLKDLLSKAFKISVTATSTFELVCKDEHGDESDGLDTADLIQTSIYFP